MNEKFITGSHRKTVGLYVKSAQVQSGAPRQVQITCKDKSKGEAVKGAIAACQPQWDYYRADTFWNNALSWGVLPGGSNMGLLGDWETFRVRCGTRAEAKDLVADIGDCMDEYGGYIENLRPGDNDAPVNTPDVPDPDPDDDKEKAIDWTTYIIIGAAVVAIIILLWPNKRRK